MTSALGARVQLRWRPCAEEIGCIAHSHARWRSRAAGCQTHADTKKHFGDQTREQPPGHVSTACQRARNR